MLCSLYMLKRFKKIKTCIKDEKQRKNEIIRKKREIIEILIVKK